MEELHIKDLIAKRKRSWNKRHDINWDKGITEQLVQLALSNKTLREEVIEKPYLLIELAFTIVDKNKDTTPFFLNEVQQEFVKVLEESGGGKPYFVLKGRQQGFTSLITAIQLSYAIVRKNFSGFTIANTSENSLAIFTDKAKMVYNRLPDALKPHEQYNSRRELFFDKLNSSWRVGVASENIGRSKTLEFLHISEIAFLECSLADLQKGLGESLVKNAIIVYETTANGYNEAKELWDNGSCHNLFFEWWKTSEYEIEDTSVLDNLNGWIATRVKWLREDKHLTEQQLAWYVNKYNGYLDKDTIKQEYPCTPEEAFISSGECIFNAEEIKARIDLARLERPSRVGKFIYRREYTDTFGHYELKDIEWVDDERGMITIHSEPHVEQEKYIDIGRETGRTLKTPYTIGGDTAGDGSDYFTAKVVDNRTLKTCATFRCQKIDEDLYAEQIACLGYLYHDALIGIEINFSIVPNNTLQALGYPNLYRRERVDTLTNAIEKKVGFATTSKTRPILIADLVRLMREDSTIECDIDTLKEMLTFVKNEKGRAEASQGSHDDLVMALGIAHFVRASQGQIEWIVDGREFNIIEELGFSIPTKKRSGGLGWYTAK